MFWKSKALLFSEKENAEKTEKIKELESKLYEYDRHRANAFEMADTLLEKTKVLEKEIIGKDTDIKILSDEVKMFHEKTTKIKAIIHERNTENYRLRAQLKAARKGRKEAKEELKRCFTVPSN